MPICSYLVMPAASAGPKLGERLSSIPGCEVLGAENRGVLLLVTDTASAGEEEAVRKTLDGIEEIEALILVFGEIVHGGGRDAHTSVGGDRRLPIMAVAAGERGAPTERGAVAEQAGP